VANTHSLLKQEEINASTEHINDLLEASYLKGSNNVVPEDDDGKVAISLLSPILTV